MMVEILSPSTAVTDRTTRRLLYARHGVPHLWLVDPEARVIESHVLHGAEYGVALRASGAQPVDLSPFADPELVPSSLWP